MPRSGTRKRFTPTARKQPRSRFSRRTRSEYGRRLYYDTCAFGQAALTFSIGAVGAGQVLFGSDDPFIGADTAHVTRLALPEADRAAVLGGNAARVLGLK